MDNRTNREKAREKIKSVSSYGPTIWLFRRGERVKGDFSKKYAAKCFRAKKIFQGNTCHTIGYFRVPPGVCIKTRLSAQPLIWK